MSTHPSLFWVRARSGLIAAWLALLVIGCAGSGSTVRESPDARYRATLQQAQALFDQQQADEGFTFLEDALRREPNSLVLGNAYRKHIVRHTQEDRALVFFKKLIEAGPASDEAHFNLAFAYIDKIPRVGPMGAGFLSKRSIAEFRAVLDRDPDNWIANYGIGMNYLHWPDYFQKNQSAASYFETCIALQQNDPLQPSHLLPYVRLGDLYAKAGEAARALEVWQEGLKHFPDHADLTDRIRVGEGEIANVVTGLYNPNNSIGAIDTDISVLWATTLQEHVCPLYPARSADGRIGGQLARAAGGESEIGLFTWFQKNLPFLSDKRFLGHVDMTPLGVEPGREAADANLIAHGMIRGFLSEFQDDSPAEVQRTSTEVGAFLRPFYHEGLGMGLAAALDAEGGEGLAQFVDRMKAVDPNYLRLHLAGAGMWYGMEASVKVERVMKAFDALGAFGSAYAYEGLGFAQALFHAAANPDLLKVGERLPPLAAKSFYHGVGRALWIRYGSDLARLQRMMAYIPAVYRGDAHSGYGMGVSFTRGSDPDFTFSLLEASEAQLDRNQFLTGVIMGYTIRHAGDPEYVQEIVRVAEGRVECYMARVLEVGQQSLNEVSASVGDLHSNWRDNIRRQVGHVRCP